MFCPNLIQFAGITLAIQKWWNNLGIIILSLILFLDNLYLITMLFLFEFTLSGEHPSRFALICRQIIFNVPVFIITFMNHKSNKFTTDQSVSQSAASEPSSSIQMEPLGRTESTAIPKILTSDSTISLDLVSNSPSPPSTSLFSVFEYNFSSFNRKLTSFAVFTCLMISCCFYESLSDAYIKKITLKMIGKGLITWENLDLFYLILNFTSLLVAPILGLLHKFALPSSVFLIISATSLFVLSFNLNTQNFEYIYNDLDPHLSDLTFQNIAPMSLKNFLVTFLYMGTFFYLQQKHQRVFSLKQTFSFFLARELLTLMFQFVTLGLGIQPKFQPIWLIFASVFQFCLFIMLLIL